MTPKARVAAFLISEGSRTFCDACIANELGFTSGVARWATLALGSGFDRRYSFCSRCGKHRLVASVRKAVNLAATA